MRYGITIIFSILFSSLAAQNDLHTANIYTTKEGLSNNTILCITRDSRGFLWIGTKEGLNRFDGFQFKKYFSEKDKLNSLSHDNIFDILEFRKNNLLIGTSNGLSVLNTITGKFENEKIKFTQLRTGSGTAVNSLYKDKDANIWVNHDGELDILDSNLVYKYRFTDLNWAKDLKGILIRFEHWYTDRSNRLWLPSDTSGIHIIDFKEKKIYNARNNPQHLPFLKSESIRSFLYDEVNDIILYAGWGEGLLSYNFSTGKMQQQLFGLKEKGEESTINTIIKNGPGLSLCFIGNAWYEINNTTLQFHATGERSALNDPGSGVITSLSILKEGIDQYFVGSNKGLYHLTGGKAAYEEVALFKAGINIGDCTDMMISSVGKLYGTFTNNQLLVSDKTHRHFEFYNLPLQTGFAPTEVCEDQLNRIWVGTQQGVYLFDTSTHLFTRPAFLSAELLQHDINHIYCDRDGDIWISTRNPFNLYRYEVRNNSLQKINNDVTDHFNLLGNNSRISEITEDEQGQLWMRSRLGGGIINFDKKKDRWKLYPSAKQHTSPVIKGGLTALLPGNNDLLWTSTVFGDGLMRYDYKKDSITQFTRNDGLPGNYILNINRDKNKNLWLTTGNGITKFNTSTCKTENTISFSETFPDNFHVVIDSLNNMLIVSLDKRLLFIPFDNKTSNVSFPVPVIDKVIVNNETQFIDPSNNKLSLSAEQKNISIDFTAVQLFNNGTVHFAYRLIGVDNDWIYPDLNRSAQYFIQAPGIYSFELKTSNELGVWNTSPATFSFSIAAPWWQRTWFRLTALLSIISIVGFLFRRRINTIRHEANMKQKIAESEMMALRAQMNPHFIFNCLNSIDNLIQTNQKEKATTYLARFAKLIRNVLDNSKNNVVPFQTDYESLQLYLQLEQFRCNNKFTYEIKADPVLLHSDYKLPPLIIQPFIENAIHHGLINKQTGDKKLTVSATFLNDCIQYIIIDNGVGRVKAQQLKDINKPEQQSYGINITSERIQLYNQDRKNNNVTITDLFENNEPSGTKVEINIKIFENN